MEAKSRFLNVINALSAEVNSARRGVATFSAAAPWNWLTWSLAEQGAFEEGIVVGREGIRVAEPFGHGI
jgi:hypothetical protein